MSFSWQIAQGMVSQKGFAYFNLLVQSVVQSIQGVQCELITLLVRSSFRTPASLSSLERLFKFGSFFSFGNLILTRLTCLLDRFIFKALLFHYKDYFPIIVDNAVVQLVGWFLRKILTLLTKASLPLSTMIYRFAFVFSNTYQQRVLFIEISPLVTCYSVTTNLSRSLILAWRGACWERMCIT